MKDRIRKARFERPDSKVLIRKVLIRQGQIRKVESMAEKKYGVILDVDGTLWDAVDVITDSWNLKLEELPDVEHPITTDQMQQCLGKTMFEIADTLFGFLPEERRREVLALAMQFEVEYLHDHPGKIYPEVGGTLKKLRAMGWHLYIVSNCQKGYIEDFLNALGEENLIEDHICFEDTLDDKGSNIRLCAERNALDYAVYVGDTSGDLASARKAGTDFIWAGYGFGEVDVLKEGVPRIGKFSDLPGKLFRAGNSTGETVCKDE